MLSDYIKLDKDHWFTHRQMQKAPASSRYEGSNTQLTSLNRVKVNQVNKVYVTTRQTAIYNYKLLKFTILL